MLALDEVPLGYDPSHVLAFRISGSWGETADMGKVSARVERTLDDLRTLPGVSAAATAGSLPGMGTGYPAEFALDGRTDAGHHIEGDSRTVSAGYFQTIGLPVLLGSACREGATTPEALVNRSFARLYFPGGPALGHALTTTAQWYGPPALIRGVVADAREDGANLPPSPTVYFCLSAPTAVPIYLVRTSAADPSAMVDTIRRRIHVLEPVRSVYDVATLRSHLDESSVDERLRTTLLTGFAALAVCLAGVGLYGTLSYLGRLRRRETGLRLTLGATRSAIAGRYLWQGLRVAGLGCLAGLLASLSLGKVLSGMLYGVSALDHATYAGVVGLVLVLAAVASLVPALRAARTEPAEALRER